MNIKLGLIPIFALTAILVTSLTACADVRLSDPPTEVAEYASDSIIVSFKADISPKAQLGSHGAAVETGYAAIDTVGKKHRAKAMKPVFHKANAARGKAKGLSKAEQRLANVYRVELATGANPLEAVADYSQLPEVEYAELDGYCYALRTDPNDHFWLSTGAAEAGLRDQWDMEIIQCAEAWDIQRGSSSVIVAVVDTGVYVQHVDLSGNIWHNSGEIQNDAIDNDGNGFVDDYFGYDFVYNDSDPNDIDGHGTHCAGTIGAVGNNGIGMAGVNWACKIMSVKGLGDDGKGKWSSVSAAVVYAADNGARVISMSLGGSLHSQALTDAVQYAHDHNAVICAAAGNDHTNHIGKYPAAYNNVITVTASDQNDGFCYFSNTGVKIAVAAPGGYSPGVDTTCRSYNLLSCRAPNADSLGRYCTDKIVSGDYYLLAGTSMACPHVAGVAALVIAQHPTWTNEQVRQAIQMRADDILDPGVDLKAGFGRLNALRAVTAPEPMTALISSPKNGWRLWDPVDVIGTAKGPNLLKWILEYGQGWVPSTWTQIATGTTPVENGVLGTWTRPVDCPNDNFVLRLRTLGSGYVTSGEYRQQFIVDGATAFNDSCTGPGVIPSLPISTEARFGFATESPTDPVLPCLGDAGNRGLNTIWYTYTPSVPVLLKLTVDGDYAWQPTAAVFTGTCGSLTNIACQGGDNHTIAALTFMANAYTKYYIEASTQHKYAFQTNESPYPKVTLAAIGYPATFDACSKPVTITSLPYSFTGETRVTSEVWSDPIIPALNSKGYNTVWWTYTPASTVNITVDTVGSDYDTVLAAWTGVCGALSTVSSNNNWGGQKTSQIQFRAYAGTTYMIEAASLTRGGGNLVLHVKQDTTTPDAFTEIFDSPGFDLQNKSITFTPDSSTAAYSACIQPISAFPTDPAGGTSVPLTDDGYYSANLTGGKQVLIYGNARSGFFIGSNGYITFDAGDGSRVPNLESHFAVRRVSALFQDLNPAAGGTVSWKQLADRAAVTYQNVPQYNTSLLNNFQVELFFDGRITLSYLTTGSTVGMTGLSAGLGVPAGYVESDFSMYDDCTVAARGLRIVFPNTGDWTEPGSIVNVSWAATGTDWQPGDTVKFDYSPDNGISWRPCYGGSDLPFDAGFFVWSTLGCSSSSTCLLRVTFTGDSSVYDVTDGTFQMLMDFDNPSLDYVPLADTDDATGPYQLCADIYDHMGISLALICWSKNGGPWNESLMVPVASLNDFCGEIPGPSVPGDYYDYYVQASDGSINAWTCKVPYPGSNRFRILPKHDYYTELFETPEVDMRYRTITFTPDGSRNYYTACWYRNEELPIPPEGVRLELPDDGFQQINLTHGRVALYGNTREAFFVGSNGYLTLDVGGTGYNPIPEAHFARKRIAGLFANLDPTQGGRIICRELEDQVVVTYLEVPEFDSKVTNTFQIQWFYDGRIAITLLSVGPSRSLIGLSAGEGVPAGFVPSDLSRYRRCSTQIPQTAKVLADGSAIDMSGAVVSGVLADRFYLEQVDRSSGIGVFWSGTMPSLGSRVRVFGSLVTGNGERMIAATSVQTESTGTPPKPLGVTNRQLGGGGYKYVAGPPETGQKGIAGAVGTNNIGLLVTVWGRVTELGPGEIARWFMLDDGSGPVRVELKTGITPPRLSDQMAVTGISSCYQSDGSLLPRVLARQQSDLNKTVP